jgi:thymidylate synthase (FAD)
MNLIILRHTPEPDKLVAMAARRCYSSREAQEIGDKMTEEEQKRMLGLLRQRNHLSPFEHVSFTFSADGVSRALSHQLVRHRIASYSQESQRYVNYLKLEQIPNIIPPSISKNEDTLNIYKTAMDVTLNAYKDLLKLGIPPEDARYIFPNAIETKLVFTLNARSLFNFWQMKC